MDPQQAAEFLKNNPPQVQDDCDKNSTVSEEITTKMLTPQQAEEFLKNNPPESETLTITETTTKTLDPQYAEELSNIPQDKSLTVSITTTEETKFCEKSMMMTFDQLQELSAC